MIVALIAKQGIQVNFKSFRCEMFLQLIHHSRMGKLECEHERGRHNVTEATDTGHESSSVSSYACDALHYIESLALIYPK